MIIDVDLEVDVDIRIGSDIKIEMDVKVTAKVYWSVYNITDGPEFKMRQLSMQDYEINLKSGRTFI